MELPPINRQDGRAKGQVGAAANDILSDLNLTSILKSTDVHGVKNRRDGRVRPGTRNMICVLACVFIVVASPLGLLVARGAAAGGSSLLLLAVTMFQLHGTLAQGAVRKQLAVVLVCIVLTSFLLSAVELRNNEEGEKADMNSTRSRIDRRQCVYGSEWEMTVGESCERHLSRDFYFHLNRNVSREDTHWPLKLFHKSRSVRNLNATEKGLAHAGFGRDNGYESTVGGAITYTYSWSSFFISLSENLGALISIESRHDCSNWVSGSEGRPCPKQSLMTSNNATCAEKLSEYLCMSLFPPCNFDCSIQHRHCGERRASHEAAANACRHILPVFSSDPIQYTSAQMREDMDSAKRWLKDYIKEDCLSSQAMSVLHDLAAPLPEVDGDCFLGHGNDCNPGYTVPIENVTGAMGGTASTLWIQFLLLLVMIGCVVICIFLPKSELDVTRFQASPRTIALVFLTEAIVAALSYSSEAIFKGVAELHDDEGHGRPEAFIARIVRLFSAIYVHSSAVSLFTVCTSSMKLNLPTFLDHRFARIGIHFYNSIALGGRFHKLTLVIYELIEVPTQLYALNEKAGTLDLPNYVIFLAVSLISINTAITPLLYLFEASIKTVLITDIALDGCVFVLNTLLIGASPDFVFADASICFPAIMIGAMTQAIFQPKVVIQSGKNIAWVENPQDLSGRAYTNSNDRNMKQGNLEMAEPSLEEQARRSRRRSLGTSIEHAVQHCCGGTLRRAFITILCCCFSVLLFLSTVLRGMTQYNACIEEHGEAWACVEPQVHFANGLFGSTACGTWKVRKFSCEGRDFEKLPNLRLFERLEVVDVTRNSKLKSIPYEVLETRDQIKVYARGSPAHEAIDWSHEHGLNISNSAALKNLCEFIDCKRIKISSASLSSLPLVLKWMRHVHSWEIVDLSDNNFTTLCGDSCEANAGRQCAKAEDCDESVYIVRSWRHLKKIDLRNNNIAGICSDNAANLFFSLATLRDEGLSSPSLLLGGNHFSEIQLDFANSDVTKAVLYIPGLIKFSCTHCDNGHKLQPLFRMTSLKELNISHLRNISEQALTAVCNLTKLEVLDLSSTSISGTIPREISMLSNLQRLRLDSTQIAGTITLEISMLNNLQDLRLHDTQISGTIPRKISLLGNLQKLLLHGTQISGTIPQDISMLTNLQQLSLYKTQISGTIPRDISMLSNLQGLGLHNTQIRGTIPREISTLSNLQILYLHNTQISGTIPREITMLSKLQGLALYKTKMNGTIPRDISMLSRLQRLRLSETQISGTIPREITMLRKLQELYLYNTQISGTIPREISMLSNLQELYLYNTQISGTIPREISMLSKLQVLYLHETKISGTIPREISMLSNLQELHLNNTQISGTIPQEISTLSNLEQLDLSNTNVGGLIPGTFSRLVQLQAVSLANSNFTNVPSELAKLQNILVMDVRGNPIQQLPPQICCAVHGLRTDFDCDASRCSHYGNPLTAAGCKADEQQFDIPLSNTIMCKWKLPF